MERFWGGDLTQKTTKFDHCGFKIGSNIYIPSTKWASAAAFFNDVKPPLFSDFKIVIAEDNQNCFNDSYSYFGISAVAMFVTLLFII